MNSTTDGNKTSNNVDITKPKVNLLDIASKNMTPEASNVVSDALERSAESMDNTVQEAENIRLTRLAPTDPDISKKQQNVNTSQKHVNAVDMTAPTERDTQ